jgi:hypothetical protein
VRFPVFGGCQKKPIKIEIVKEGDKRFLLRIYGDGSEERQPIVVKEEATIGQDSLVLGFEDGTAEVLLKYREVNHRPSIREVWVHSPRCSTITNGGEETARKRRCANFLNDCRELLSGTTTSTTIAN